MAAMPTVLLAVHQGFAARYLLRTDILPTLRAAGARVVIVTPNADEPYMAREFAANDVVLEPLRADVDIAAARRGAQALITLRHFTLAGGQQSRALVEKLASYRRRARATGRAGAFAVGAAVPLLWRSAALRRAILALERRLSTEQHADIFERHRPDLVVTTSPGWFFPDAVVLREAQARAIPTACVLLSWDNPTSKGYRGAMPDLVLTWSKTMSRQVVEHHDVPERRVEVAGVPHFDHYVRAGALPSREGICAELGLDAQRRIVLFAASSPGLYRESTRVAARLADAIESGELGAAAQLVVRVHPLAFRSDHGDALHEWEAFAARHPLVRVQFPEVLSTRLRCDMSRADARRLGALIRHCDVLVNVFSTTTLEACLADRPVVLLTAASATSDEPGTFEHTRDYETFEHMRTLVGARAARVARSLDEMVAHVRSYLADPSLEREGRAAVAAAELGPTDGRAGERIGLRLLGLIEAREAPDAFPGPTLVGSSDD